MSYEEYGRFDDRNREFVITDPFTPRTWINYLSNRTLFAVLSQGACGMAFHDGAATGRLARYHQGRSMPVEQPGLWICLRERDRTLWSPSYQPCRTALSGWKCRHGQGYTVFEGA